MNVRSCRDFKDRADEGKSKCVAHGIDENVGDEGGDGFVCEDYGADGLA